MMSETKIILFLFVIILMYFVYFIPTFIAFKRLHYNRIFILICNLLFGWTIIGWILLFMRASNNNIEVKN